MALAMGFGLTIAACDSGEAPSASPDAASRSASGAPPSAAPDTPPSPDAAAANARPPIVPAAPWFELPADWSEQHPTLSPNAHLEVHAAALAERQLVDTPADLAGRFRLESVEAVGARAEGAGAGADGEKGGRAGERPVLRASSHQRFRLVFEVGEPGIADGGTLFLLADPFWFWSPVQTSDPNAAGYTTAALRTAAGDEAGDDEAAGGTTPRPKLVPSEAPGAFRVEGRALHAGEQIELVYGAGPAGAKIDRYAEIGSEMRLGLDGDADGRRAWIAEAVAVDVVAGPAVELVAFGPAEVAPGEAIELVVSLVDEAGNRASWPEQTSGAAGRTREAFVLESLDRASAVPTGGVGRQTSEAAASEPHRLRLVAPTSEGTLRLRIRGEGPLARFEVDVPPIVVRRAPRRLVFGDLHGHTRYSDGTGSPDAYFRYARDVARLDVVALTDHDHWGIDALDESPARQAEILALAKTYHAPGRFVTLPGYEWTSWLHGHRHVLSFVDELEMLSSIDAATDRPDELWAALRGKPVLTFAHHSAGEPIATNWHYLPDPELEPVTEIASVHGMSEALDAPAPIGGAVPGNFVRDVLLHGARLGFIGSGDSHDGHPGLAQIASGQSGLAGLFVEALERDAIHAALRRRHTFATNGIRPWLDVRLDGVEMGGSLASDAAGAAAEHILEIRYEATAPVERVELIRTGHRAVVDLLAATGTPQGRAIWRLDLERRIPRLGPGEFHYVRILQVDGGVAWSSPIFAATATDGKSDAGASPGSGAGAGR
ncbi:MAG: CehA/McbA family metallohydrolase [Myxococcota bacterium]